MAKKETTDKAVAAKSETKQKKASSTKKKADKVTQDVKPEANAPVDTEIKPVEGTESQSDTNTPPEGFVAHRVTKDDLENNPETDLQEGEVVFIPQGAEGEPISEEGIQTEVDKLNKKEFDKIQSLKAVAYNEFRDTSFKKLKKSVKYKDLSDLSNLPAEVNHNSEILMSNGQIYTMVDGLTNKFSKESLNYIK